MLHTMQITNTASPGLTMSATSDEVNENVSYSSRTENFLYSIKFRAMIFFQILAYGSYSVLSTSL